MRRRFFGLITAAVTVFGMCTQTLPAFAAEPQEEIIVLYTNDVHCGIDDHIGYDGLKLYKRELEAQGGNVILADAGDAIQGDIIGTFTDGEAIISLMNEVGYDVATIGNHEFDYGIDELAQRSQELDCGYVCCNFRSLTTGELIYEPYKIIEAGGQKIAFVGVATPETFSSSTPAYFQNDQGEYIYSFAEKEGELYSVVQQTVNNARNEGADRVIVIGHLGENGVSEKWSSPELVARTEGIDAVIDGHSHETTPSLTVKNKNGEDVVISQTGTKLANIGKMTITADGIKTELISTVPEPVGLEEGSWTQAAGRNGISVDSEINGRIEELNDRVNELLSEVFGYTEFKLYDSDPETGERRVRNGETNLADLLADAMRDSFGTDVAFINGGGIRKSIEAGDITYADLLGVYPYGNQILAARVTGQQILDMLELGAMTTPVEAGAFLSGVSGIEYTVDTSVKSTVTVDEYGTFTGVTGEYRVKNVKIGGEPLDPEKTYTVASINYLLRDGGDGYIMSGKCDIYRDGLEYDIAQLADYIKNTLGGVIPGKYRAPEGQGRVHIVDGVEEETSGDPGTESGSGTDPAADPGTDPQTDPNPDTGKAAAVFAILAAICLLTVLSKKKDSK
ncbi:MAG: bifunctional metallophosphatase/5'-nucleotidase [Ruminococcus sp.]|nr:bifunctional metallophosphatase/5'-nucleotidase [Ruminococcus sp.]